MFNTVKKAFQEVREDHGHHYSVKRSLDTGIVSSLSVETNRQKKKLRRSVHQKFSLKLQPLLLGEFQPFEETIENVLEVFSCSHHLTSKKGETRNLLSLPEDVLICVMTHLTTMQDRQNCITVCKRFQELRNDPLILAEQMLESHCGASFDGLSVPPALSSGILRDAEDSSEAFDLLYEFANVGNTDALYM